MTNRDRGRHAGKEARRVGASFEPPNLKRTIQRRRRGRIVMAFSTTALVVVAAIGIGALFMRTETESIPVGTTTTTTMPDQPVTTPTTTTLATTPTTEAVALPTEPVYGGVLKMASSTDLVFGYTDIDDSFVPPTINPLLDPWNASDVARLTVPGAYRIDAATGELTPWVVTHIPRTDNGGVAVSDTVTVTYHIRPEAVWADDTPISAEDFFFTHELIMRDDLRIDSALRDIHSLIKTDTFVAIANTITFDLVAPDPRYERLFEWIVPAHAVDPETFADDWNKTLWLSAGPFVFDSYEPSPDTETQPGIMRLSRNDSYWEFDPATGQQLPYLDGIELQIFTPGSIDSLTLSTWFTTQATDLMLGGTIDRFTRPYLGDPVEEGFVLLESCGTLYEVLAFQFAETRLAVNPDSLNGELLYRQAVLAAIDRSLIAAEMNAPAVTSIVGTAMPGQESDAWAQHDDVTQVPGLLNTLGADLGRDFSDQPPTAVYISSYADTTIQIGRNVATQLTAAGIETSTDFEGDFFGTQLPEGLTDLFAFRTFALPGTSGLLQSLTIFDPSLPADQLILDWSSVGEPAQRYAVILDEAAATLDSDRLLELLQEAEAILADNAIIYPLVRRQVSLHPYWPERIQGLVPNQQQGWSTATAAFWWSPQG